MNYIKKPYLSKGTRFINVNVIICLNKRIIYQINLIYLAMEIEYYKSGIKLILWYLFSEYLYHMFCSGHRAAKKNTHKQLLASFLVNVHHIYGIHTDHYSIPPGTNIWWSTAVQDKLSVLTSWLWIIPDNGLFNSVRSNWFQSKIYISSKQLPIGHVMYIWRVGNMQCIHYGTGCNIYA